MRDIIVLALVFIGAGMALPHPYIGVLFWTWVSIMNPHRLTWGMAQTFPVAALIGGATLIGLFISRDKKNFYLTPVTAFFILFVIWMIVTFPFSFNPERSSHMLIRVIKIDLMALVALILLYSKRHILSMVWVLVFSVGFFGIKGGVFTLLTGGINRVWGPPDSFIAGNNEMALALIMIIPFMYFLREQTQKRWQRLMWLFVMGVTAVGVIGTQSRGAFLAIMAMLGLLWLRSRQKLMIGVLIIAGSVMIYSFMPESWHERMDTIVHYHHDASAMGRINAWHMAWNLASHNFFGGGFDIYNANVFLRYAPIPQDIHAAHSIYFQVLGEHGFVGLALFLAIWWLAWRDAKWIRKNAGLDPETKWAETLASMCQVSLIGYAVGGAFLSLAYFDFPYDILVLIVLMRRWVEINYSSKDNQEENVNRISMAAEKVGQ